MRSGFIAVLLLSAFASTGVAQTIELKSLNGPFVSDGAGGTRAIKNGSKIIVDSAGKVYVASYDGLFTTADHGLTWRHLTSQPIGAMAFSPKGVLYVVGAYGCLSSPDSGGSWKNLNDQLPSQSIYSIAISPKSGSLFVGTQQAIYRSSDEGIDWTNVTGKLPPPSSSKPFMLAMTPKGTLIVDANDLYYRSIDEAKTWTTISEAPVRFVATASGALVGASKWPGGVFLRSADDGKSWSSIATGYTDDFMMDVTSDAYGNIFAGSNYFGGSGHFFRSNNEGLAWSRYLTTANIAGLGFSRNNLMYVGTLSSGMYRSLQPVSSVEATMLNAIALNPIYEAQRPTLRCRVVEATIATLSVYDVRGVAIFEAKEQFTEDQSIELPELTSGLYFCRLQASNGPSATCRILVR